MFHTLKRLILALGGILIAKITLGYSLRSHYSSHCVDSIFHDINEETSIRKHCFSHTCIVLRATPSHLLYVPLLFSVQVP